MRDAAPAIPGVAVIVGKRGMQFAAPRYGFKPTAMPRPPAGVT
ncbi:PPE family protein, SVP subgroup [Mycobacterium sp.]